MTEAMIDKTVEDNIPLNGKSVEKSDTYSSQFTGGVWKNFLLSSCLIFVSVLTLGFAYPAFLCVYLRWKANNTIINGRKLCFTGTAGELFEKYILWLFLSAITLGIYYVICMDINMLRWQARHTHVEGERGKTSYFDGHWYQLFGVRLVAWLVAVVTLTFGAYWAHCYLQRWVANHTVIDGARQKFTGTGLQYFAKCIVWVLLTIVTVGIYSLWLDVKIMQWTTKHTVFVNPQVLSVKPRNGDAEFQGKAHWINGKNVYDVIKTLKEGEEVVLDTDDGQVYCKFAALGVRRSDSLHYVWLKTEQGDKLLFVNFKYNRLIEVENLTLKEKVLIEFNEEMQDDTKRKKNIELVNFW